MNDNIKKYCGWVGLFGEPNSGKSTLMNALVGQNISIVSPKVQTTRGRILGVVTDDPHQMIFLDTPGIFKAQRTVEKAILDIAMSTFKDVEIVVFLIDIAKSDLDRIVYKLSNLHIASPLILVLNKIDLVPKDILLKWASKLSHFNAPIFMISALKKDGIDALIKHIKSLLSPGAFVFDKDDLTNMPSHFLACEMTRKQLFFQLDHELPYHTYVEHEKWDETDDMISIHQCIVVPKDTHKRIVVSKIKDIGSKARQDMMAFFGKKIRLDLFVKVEDKCLDMLTKQIQSF
jgi:GTP-binding protein Era